MAKISSIYFRFGALLLTGLVLVGCSASSKLPVLNEWTQSAADSGGFINIASTQGALAKKVKKLVIPSFNVTYKLQVEGTAEEVIKEGDKEVTRSIEMKVNMENANISMMQRLTNKAYEVFVAELKQSGYEVVSLDDVSKSDMYYQVNHMDNATSVTPDDGEVTLAVEGLKYFDPDEAMDPDGGFWMGVSNINSAIYGDLVDEFGGTDEGVAALNVSLAVQFGNFDLENHRVSQFIPFNPSFTSIIAEGTNVDVITGFKAVSMPGRVFYIPEERMSFSMSQDMGSRTNVITGILEVGSTEGSREYNATINEDAFEKVGVDQIKQLSEIFSEAIKAQI